MMREAYLLNRSQSEVSIPLYDKVPVNVRGRIVNKTEFVMLKPGQEHVVGTDLPVAKKKYYSQFSRVLVDLKFRDKDFDKPAESQEGDGNQGNNQENPPEETDSAEKPAEDTYTEKSLMAMRQADLIEIAAKMGIEATKDNSKAQITTWILEKQKGE